MRKGKGRRVRRLGYGDMQGGMSSLNESGVGQILVLSPT